MKCQLCNLEMGDYVHSTNPGFCLKCGNLKAAGPLKWKDLKGMSEADELVADDTLDAASLAKAAEVLQGAEMKPTMVDGKPYYVFMDTSTGETHNYPVPVEPSCEGCQYFKESTEVNTGNECRRYPPTTTFIPSDDCHFTCYPTVGKREWCGEFKANARTASEPDPQAQQPPRSGRGEH